MMNLSLPKQNIKEISYALRKARLGAGFKTARSFARAYDLSEATYYQYENGLRNPTIATLKKLSQLLNINLGELLPQANHVAPNKNCSKNGSNDLVAKHLAFGPTKISPTTSCIDSRIFGINTTAQHNEHDILPETALPLLEEIADKIAEIFDEVKLPLTPRLLVKTTLDVYKNIRALTSNPKKQFEMIPAMTSALKNGLIYNQNTNL